MPAPLGNTNASRHGLRTRFSLRLGKLPKKFRAVENDVNAFRRLLESLIVEAKGEITILDACLVNTAAKHERASRLCHAWLRKHDSDMSHSDRLSYVKQIASSSAERDKAIRSLNLEASGEADIWKDLHSPIASPALAQPSTDAPQIDTPQSKSRQLTESQSGASPTASPVEGQKGEVLGTRFSSPENGFPEVSTSSGRIVSSEGDNESTADQNIAYQQSESKKYE